MKKEIEGYIARYDDDILFSNEPMKKEGFFGDGDVWYDTLETEEDSPLDLRVDMHNYLDIPELTFENSPRRCKLTIEIGEQLPGNGQREIDLRIKAMRIRSNVRELAATTGMTYQEIVDILRKSIPDIDEYPKEETMERKKKPLFDGFDSNGKPTGNKCILCIHQDKECPFQSFFGEGALLICTYDLEKCFKEE